MSNPVLRQFRYRLPRLQMLLVSLAASGGLCIAIYGALNPEVGPAQVRGIPLTAAQNQALWVAIALLILIGVGSCAIAFGAGSMREKRIALTADSIILPKPDWWKMATRAEEMELPYDDIVSASVIPFVGHAVQLLIIYDGGRVGIPSNMLPSRRDFDLLANLVAAALDHRDSTALVDEYEYVQ